MKLTECITMLAFSAVLAIGCRAQLLGTDVAPTFSIALKSPSESFKIGEPIPLALTITNLSESPIGLEAGPGSAMLERHFFVIAVGADGKMAEERQYALLIHGKLSRSRSHNLGSGSSYMEVIAPGASVQHEIDANKLYDFGVPGTYDLYIQRNYDSDASLFVKSNHIKIIVTGPAQPSQPHSPAGPRPSHPQPATSPAPP